LIKSFLKRNYLSIIIGLTSLVGLYFVSLYSYILYHSLVEFFSITIAFVIFVIAWNSKKFLDNQYLLFVGIAYLFVTLIDLLHTLAYKGMDLFISFPGANLATQLWISTRYLESISLLLAIFFITRRLNYKVLLIIYVIVTALILLSIFYWKIFPVSFLEDTGLTPFKIISEYIISFILIVAIFLIYFYRQEFNRTVFILIVVSLFAKVVSEISFALYKSDVYGLFNQFGHYLKLLSFFFIYKAIVETGFSQPQDLMFFKLKKSEKELKESEEKFRSLYFSMNEGAALQEIIYNKSGKPVDYRIIDVNNAYESILGIKRDQAIGKKASEVYGTDMALYIKVYAKVAESGIPARFETYFPPLKKYFFISVFSPSRERFATVFSDITERKKIEKEINSLSRFPSENPNPIIRINDKSTITYLNKPAEVMLNQLGNDKKKKLLKHLHDLVGGRKKEKINESKKTEIKIGDSVYELTIVPIKEFNYFNIYGRDITERKKAERLNSKIQKEKALNEERNKLARELHDTVTQTLFSANLIAEVIPKIWKKDPEAVIKRLEEVRQLNSTALMEMRILLYGLRPSDFKNENLGNLLKALLKTLDTRSRIPIELKIDGEYKFPPKIEFGYYRIAQEALNNIIKHSNATKASLILKTYPESIYMNISDNGRGFYYNKINSTSLGLTIIRERAKLIGASIDIESIPGKGTRITVIYNKKKKIQKKIQ